MTNSIDRTVTATSAHVIPNPPKGEPLDEYIARRVGEEIARQLASASEQQPDPKPRLLVIDPDGMPIDGNAGYWSAWASEVLAGPDVMELIEQAVHDWQAAGGMVTVATLLTRIRTALEGATQ